MLSQPLAACMQEGYATGRHSGGVHLEVLAPLERGALSGQYNGLPELLAEALTGSAL